MIKKGLAILLSSTLLVSSVPLNCFASSSNIGWDSSLGETDVYVDETGVYEKMPEISDEELERAIEKAIKLEVGKVRNKEVAKDMESELRKNLIEDVDSQFIKEGGVRSRGNILGDLLNSFKENIPNVHIKNKYVAATVNTIITATLIVIGVGTISVALQNMVINNWQKCLQGL